MEFTSDGVIEAGIHESTLEEFYNIFVDGFSVSQTRIEIFNSFLSFINIIRQKYTPSEIWIDGSYVTKKINPNDIDILLFFMHDDFINISSEWANYRNNVHIDMYPAMTICEDTKSKLNAGEYQNMVNNRNYWRGQFGFDRYDTPKGIIRINWDKVIECLDGGGLNCQ